MSWSSCLRVPAANALAAPRLAARVPPLTIDGRAFRGAIFDLDGVVAPTLENHVRAYRETLAPLGVPVEHMDVALREGQRSPEIIAWIAERHGQPLAPARVAELSERKNAVYRSLPIPPPYPGLRDLLTTLRGRGLATALATGTHGRNVPHVLGDLVALYDAFVAAEDVTRPKPDPEPYVKAAGKLGLDPRECLVVENAPLGVTSGKAAGCFVLAVTTTLPAERLKEADRVLPSIGAVLELVREAPAGSA